MIQNIIQTWKTEDLSDANPLFRISSESWQAQNPLWNYSLVDDQFLDTYVKQHLPKFHKSTFTKYQAQIQRVDIFRIIFMFFDGGLYSDLDAEAIAPFDLPAEQTRGIVLGSLANKASGQHIPNAFLYAGTIQDRFWAYVLAEAEKRFRNTKGFDGAEYLTGPALLTSCFYSYKGLSTDECLDHIQSFVPEICDSIGTESAEITILEAQAIYPIDWTTLSPEELNTHLRNRMVDKKLPVTLMNESTFCINYWTHSWEIPERDLWIKITERLRWIRNIISGKLNGSNA